MSNASLKEQLQALSLEKNPSNNATKTKPKEGSKKLGNSDKQHAPKSSAPKQKPAWLEYAQYGVELLKAHFPECFKGIKEIKPLKVGIKQDLVKALSTREEIVIGDKACMVSSLSYYVNSPSYHKTVVAGAPRIDLQGNTSGVVSAEEAQYSLDFRQNKLQKKKNSVAGVISEPEKSS